MLFHDYPDISKPAVVAVISKKPIDTALKAQRLGADILELRIDLIQDGDIHSIIKEIKSLDIPVIATNRMKQEGGGWAGSEKERIEVLLSVLDHVDAVDIELAASGKKTILEEAKVRGKTVIVSSHDFNKTPPKYEMKKILAQSYKAGADISKIAVMPSSLRDVLALLEVTLESEFPVCTIAMGKLGMHSRVIAPIYGSVLTYGFVEDSVAPGQMRVDELKNALRLLGF